MYYGIAWLPLSFLSIILFVLLVVPGANRFRDDALKDPVLGKAESAEKANQVAKENRVSPATGKIFWIIITLLAIAIILGIINPQWAL